MKATSRPRTAYHRLVRSFDHSDLAALPGYPALRQALGDIASQVPGTALAAFAAAVRDMAVTAPFADLCGACSDPGAVQNTTVYGCHGRVLFEDARGPLAG